MTTAWPRPDFLDPRRRVPVLAWVWAVTGALVLAVSVGEALVMQQGIDARGLLLDRATQRVARAAPVQTAASVRQASVSANATPDNKADAIRAAQRVLTQLGHPWGQIMSTVESETPAGLQWLLFDHTSDSPDLRFEGLTPDVSTVLQLVDALSGRTGWSTVALSRLQAPEVRASAATPLMQFEITATVDAQRILLAASPDADH